MGKRDNPALREKLLWRKFRPEYCVLRQIVDGGHYAIRLNQTANRPYIYRFWQPSVFLVKGNAIPRLNPAQKNSIFRIAFKVIKECVFPPCWMHFAYQPFQLKFK